MQEGDIPMLVWQERYCLDRSIGSGGVGCNGCSAAVCLPREVARNLETPSFSSSISLSLWALKDCFAFVGCWRISQKHFPSLNREKVRANHVELKRLPHNHECAFSDIIKLCCALKHASTGWLCSRGKCASKKEGKRFSLLLLVLLYEVSLDWLHQTLHYAATAWGWQQLLNFSLLNLLWHT